MAFLYRWVLVLTLMLSAAPRLGAAGASEKGAFNAASAAFRDGFYDRAEKEFGGFARSFTNSSRLPEALLFQAEARFKQTNYAGAIELLSAHQNQAGRLADEYLFWVAEACSQLGNYQKACDLYAGLIRQFPSSPRCLEAGIGSAAVRAKLGEWPQVIELLRQTNGVFQSAARTSAASRQVIRGRLLLSEACLAQRDYAAAEAELLPLQKLALAPADDWERQYLLCRIQLAAGRTEDALGSSTNLIALATGAAQRDLLAAGIVFQADLLERLGRHNEAIAAYTKILGEGFKPERQRQALLKITGLFLAQNQTAEAARTLEKFLSLYPETPAADMALLTLGELRLLQYDEPASGTNGASIAATNAPEGEDHLQQALAALSGLEKRFPQSPLTGKAQLDLGWCYWLQRRMPESQAAFQIAAARLPVSADQARAYFKLADAEFQQKDFAGAMTNYMRIVEQFAALPEVRTNFFEGALYQTVRAGLAGGDLAAATNALKKILAWYPDSFNAGRSVLLAGQEISRRGDHAEAREILSEYVRTAPEAPLRSEVELAIARSYEQEKLWTNVIAQYDGWLVNFTNNEARPRVEYYRAWANFQAGLETNAFMLYTNFIAEFPTNEFTPLAQWWVGDYEFRRGHFEAAENNYQLLFQNAPGTTMAYEAQMMAGRSAVARQGWSDARDYFKTLARDTNCPPDLRAQALFAYGDALMSLGDSMETNKLANYEDAISAFNGIVQLFPTNRLAVLALGEKANCLLQWGQYSHDSDSITNALNAFQQVGDSPGADVAMRSMALVGEGTAFEMQAQQKTGPEQVSLLRLALDNYLDAFYYEKNLKAGERPDLFWVKKAGLEAARVAEALQEWTQAISIYRRLQDLLPMLRASLEQRILKAQDKLARTAD